MSESCVRAWNNALGAALAVAVVAAANDRAAAQQQPAPFEVVALLQQAPGNIAITHGGRIIVSQHQFQDPVYRVVEVLDDGTTQPFPNEAWASAPGADGRGMVAVLGIRADPAGLVWMLDNGSRPPRLIGWDLNADQLAKIIPIPPPAAPEASFLTSMFTRGR